MTASGDSISKELYNVKSDAADGTGATAAHGEDRKYENIARLSVCSGWLPERGCPALPPQRTAIFERTDP